MKTEILNFLLILIDKVKKNELKDGETLVLSSLISLYDKEFPLEEKKTLEYLFTGWYIHELMTKNEVI